MTAAAERTTVDTDVGVVTVVSTSRADGDFAVTIGPPDFDVVRAEVTPHPWTWLQQVHGAEVVTVGAPGEHAGSVADGVVTSCPEAAIAVTTADCGPLVMIGTSAVGVAHVGWKGLMAGVVGATAARLRAAGATPVRTILGPCIQPQAYEFSDDDLDLVAARFGPTVRGRTESGAPALDLVAAISAACAERGWPGPARPPCTSGRDFFSHRTRGDRERLTTVAWIGSRLDGEHSD